MLPPGREKLGTRPAATGLPLDANTIGIVLVARLAASEPGVPAVTITSGLRRTNSAAKAARRLSRPSAPRNSIRDVLPDCARAQTGHAAAAPSRLMKSRRLTAPRPPGMKTRHGRQHT